ncbi:hypothetical protein [Pseudomonas syringae]|uniref:hypothetical protein n=1 Tax=Pseudomonas syringae TaxID=317 RepID=UPI00200AABF5|nr:hypothetical protein [Pseudomonas syringae]MCK9735536.1 hypothetical protein [Pseudomonas syringae pv. syringae]MCL6307148.1 hypothetical protein [Pseudomonas syringae]
MDNMRPLYRQYDSGFGAIADSFKFSADLLDENPQSGGLESHLPISYLYRHSIELYLKSCVVIFHRRFSIPYEDTKSGDAAILVTGKPTLLKDIHALNPLLLHLKSIIASHIQFLSTLKDTDWDFSPELQRQVVLIDGIDSSSTFFRYPITKDKPKDRSKTVIQPSGWDDMVKKMNYGTKPVKAFIFLDENDNIVESFSLEDEKVVAMTKMLRETAEDFCGFHAMVAWKLVEGR